MKGALIDCMLFVIVKNGGKAVLFTLVAFLLVLGYAIIG